MKLAGVIWICLLSLAVAEVSASDARDVMLGVNTHLGQRWQRLPLTNGILAKTEFVSLRDEVYWSRVELVRGELRYPAEIGELQALARTLAVKGGRLVVVLGYGNKFYDNGRHPRSDSAIAAYANYCRFVAKAFSGYQVVFEIWNEWNSELGVPRGGGVGSPSEYVKLLRTVVPAIRSAAADATIVSTGLARGVEEMEWLRRFISLGGASLVDGLGLHLYIFNKPGWTASRLKSWLENISKEASPLGDAVRQKGVYVTEFGVPLKGDASREMRSELIDGLEALAESPVVRGVWVYQLVDDHPSQYRSSSDDESNFGMFDFDGNPKAHFGEVNELIGRFRH